MAVFDKNIRILMLKGEKGEIGDAGDYSTLQNKPKINSVELNGNKNTSDLGLADVSDINSLQADIGTLENLQTIEKSNIVGAINEINYRNMLLGSTTLYEGEGVSDGVIDLTDNPANYEKITFYFSTNISDENTEHGSVTIDKVTANSAVLSHSIINENGNTVWIYSAYITINSSDETPEVSFVKNYRCIITANSVDFETSGLAIYKIVGYKI